MIKQIATILFHKLEPQWKTMAANRNISLNATDFESDPES